MQLQVVSIDFQNQVRLHSGQNQVLLIGLQINFRDMSAAIHFELLQTMCKRLALSY